MSDENVWKLDYLSVSGGTDQIPTATVRLKKGDEVLLDSAIGNGFVNAVMKAIDRIINCSGRLIIYFVKATAPGSDAFGEVVLRVDFGDEIVINGQGESTDIIEASAKAYLNAVNRYIIRKNSSI